ncbi:MAG: UvrD-helicase domain-containing protein [Betaproteobacteria bacterium]|nr:UvrD-helicase domain-containing protein [Betaproteobacteria bacterium]
MTRRPCPLAGDGRGERGHERRLAPRRSTPLTHGAGISDLEQRRHALDPTRSFIVQAPAGSGKTELLIQRYLVLLSRVRNPEEIAAITFTKKAAGEMRKRVLEALASARAEEKPPEPHRALTWEQARAALARDRELGWRLEENAARLRIQTIDALCASLTRQMPVLAAFGAQPRSIEDAGPLYREAARATLALVEEKGQAADDVAKLLAHLDNDVSVAADLLAGMLQKRDHWIRNLRGAHDREALEAALAAVRRDAMMRVRQLLHPAPEGSPLEGEWGQSIQELLGLATYAADNLAAADKRSWICECADLAALPGASEADMFAWLGLAELLLTGAGEWRRGANSLIGFPAGTDKAGKAIAKDWKEYHAALIARLAHLARSDELREALHDLRRLPPERYTDAQWEALGAIARLLPLALAELKLVFAARGEADFVEIAQGALVALGESEAPTDLMLSLDYRIHHILVDEFQDTSFTQFELLHKLTAGWQPDDGRTLFLVGDPMQSIYRFREAEVGLFLKARHEGIGQVALEPLTLSANFRSQAGIVAWVNRAFAQVMPMQENVAAGAVPYSPSDPVHPAASDAVGVHAFFGGDAQAEAEQVAALIEAAQRDDPEGCVAVLVRNRSHLAEIVPRLKERELSFRAIEIEALGHRQAVQDLLALTRALAHPADRIAWLALLRAPWCGLTLADLHALVRTDPPHPHREGRDGDGVKPPRDQRRPLASRQLPLFSDAPTPLAPQGTGTRGELGSRRHATLWELLEDDIQLAHLSADARTRLERVRGVLHHAMNNRLRGTLRDRVEAAWLALGGPACVENDTDLEDIEIYLDYLEDSEHAGEIADLAAFEQGLADLYALADLQADPDTAVQIMTIHKAKGLEFDTVIVPGLGRAPRKRDPSLFLWTERPSSSPTPIQGAGRGGDGVPSSPQRPESSLLLAPIKQTGTEADLAYDYLVRLDAEKESHEEGRLLYVAATRARRHLHLLGDTRLDASADEAELDSASRAKSPSSGSLLAKLWPAVESDFAEAARTFLPRQGEGEGGGGVRPPGSVDQDLRRLPTEWSLPEIPPRCSWSPPKEPARVQDAIEFSWAGETARHVGSVVHRWLQRIADDQMKGWSRARIGTMREAFRDELTARGVEEKELSAATERVARALANSLDDPRGKWLLGTQADARNEYRLTASVDGERRNLVIDRVFIDSQGRRWIVDYKTSSHEGGELDAFLDRERVRYAAQLERYARALGEAEPAGLGLYFPLVSGWRDWQFVGEALSDV